MTLQLLLLLVKGRQEPMALQLLLLLLVKGRQEPMALQLLLLVKGRQEPTTTRQK
jgi:hypothetical protein